MGFGKQVEVLDLRLRFRVWANSGKFSFHFLFYYKFFLIFLVTAS